MWKFLNCLLQHWAFPASPTRLLRSPSHLRWRSSTVPCLRPQWKEQAGIWVHNCVGYFSVWWNHFYCYCEKKKHHLSLYLSDHYPPALLSVGSRRTPTSNSKVLEFNLMGEGNLPSVCVVRPALRNRRGSPMLLFRRLFVGRRRTLPLVLHNNGNVPAQVRGDQWRGVGSVASIAPTQCFLKSPESYR